MCQAAFDPHCTASLKVLKPIGVAAVVFGHLLERHHGAGIQVPPYSRADYGAVKKLVTEGLATKLDDRIENSRKQRLGCVQELSPRASPARRTQQAIAGVRVQILDCLVHGRMVHVVDCHDSADLQQPIHVIEVHQGLIECVKSVNEAKIESLAGGE